MTEERLEDLHQWEIVLRNELKTLEILKKRIIKEFDLLDIEYDEKKDEIRYLAEGPDNDYGSGIAILNHIDEMVQEGWGENEKIDEKAQEEWDKIEEEFELYR